MIEKILITNVERLSLRRYCALGALASLGYPVNSGILSFIKCHDQTLFDTTQSVIDAAVGDGFQFFEQLEYHDIGRLLNEKNSVIWLWSWVCCLREIIESDKLTLLLIDDRPPIITWERMNKIVEEVHDEQFHGIQLDVNVNLRFEYESILPISAEVTSSCGLGFVCENDMGFVLSPKGAAFLLDTVQCTPGDMPYTTIQCRTEPGFYHVLQSVTDQVYAYNSGWQD